MWFNTGDHVIQHRRSCDSTQEIVWSNTGNYVIKHRRSYDPTQEIMWSNKGDCVIQHRRSCDSTQEIMWSNTVDHMTQHRMIMSSNTRDHAIQSSVIHYRRWKSLMQSGRLSVNISYGTILTDNWDIGKSSVEWHSAIVSLNMTLHYGPCHYEHNSIYPSNM